MLRVRKLREGAGSTTLDRADWYSEAGRSLPLGQADEVPKNEDLAVDIRQGRQRSLDGISNFNAAGRVIGRRINRDRVRERQLAGPLPTPRVAKRVDQDLVDIRVDVVGPAYFFPRHEALEERGLG